RPITAFGGPVVVIVKLTELVLVKVPVTAPDTVQVPPICPMHGTPGTPLLVGGVLVGVSATAVSVSGWIVGVAVAVSAWIVGVAVAVSACAVAVCTMAVCVVG